MVPAESQFTPKEKLSPVADRLTGSSRFVMITSAVVFVRGCEGGCASTDCAESASSSPHVMTPSFEVARADAVRLVNQVVLYGGPITLDAVHVARAAQTKSARLMANLIPGTSTRKKGRLCRAIRGRA